MKPGSPDTIISLYNYNTKGYNILACALITEVYYEQ